MAAAWAEAMRRGVREDEEALLAATPAAIAIVDAGNGDSSKEGDHGIKADDLLKVERLGRQDDIERGYESAVKGLGRLKREMPAVVARMERARDAGQYVVTER